MPAIDLPSEALQQCWIQAPEGSLRRDFDRQHFEVTHDLVDHPLLQLPQLMALADRTLKSRPSGIYYDMGKDVRIDQRWDQMPEKQFPVIEAMDRIESCGAWFLFKDVQNDPAYQDFLGRGWEKIKQE